MEFNEQSFMEELLSQRRENWESFPNGMSDQFFSSSGWSLDCFSENQNGILPSSCFEGFNASIEPSFNCSLNDVVHYPFDDGYLVSEMNSWHQKRDTPPFPIQEDVPLIMEEDEHSLFNNDFHSFEEAETSCKLESSQAPETPVFNIGLCDERKNKIKKVDGQPSKNLMAERRRRKRLNDRLSMLRSVVPRISKMDRTSILGDTIDYMKELLDKIKNYQDDAEEDSEGSYQLNFKGILKDLKPNEILVRNTPKFDVERRNTDTRVNICCTSKPGLLLSTVSTLEALGLEIQQCVISCFNDFEMQASCSEELEKRGILSSEEMKQALFRNAGYGARFL